MQLDNRHPVGVIGELYIGGVQVARGYLNRPELTAERFIANPFATPEDQARGYDRLYKTGDLVRWFPDGNLEYIGRNDFQVKIRGFRIELGEIENNLRNYPTIKHSVIMVHEREGTKSLVAYYVAEKPISDDRLLEHLATKLPDYMIPSVFVHLESLPLTSSGKLDRRALPEPECKAAASYVAPRNELEAKMVEVWQQVLHLQRVGIEDDFFRLGGDSILSIQLTSRLRHLGLSLSVKDIFSYRRIAQLVVHVPLTGEHVCTAEQGALTGSFEFLPVQQWFFQQRWNHPEHWNQSFLIKTPLLDVLKLPALLNALATHHDALRLRFSEKGMQTYQEHITIAPLRQSDAGGWRETERRALFTEWQSHFHIGKGPLWQAGYVEGYTDGSARIYLALHHLIVDSVSWRILTEDLRRLYDGESLGEKSSSYRQWVEEVKSYAKHHQDEKAYWEALIRDQPSYRGYSHLAEEAHEEEFKLSREYTQVLLRGANLAYHTQINDLLLTALSYALKEWHGAALSYITLEGHGREPFSELVDVSRTVGWFTTMFPVRLELAQEMGQSIQQIKESLRGIPHKGLGYGALKQWGESAALSSHSLPEISFNYLGQFASAEWVITNESSGANWGSGNRDNNVLTLNGLIAENQLQFSIHSQLPVSLGFGGVFRRYLEKVIDHCAQRLRSGESVYTPSDFPTVKIRQELLNRLQDRYRLEDLYPASSLQQGFIYHALTYPEDEAYRLQLLVDYPQAMDTQQLQAAWRYVLGCFPGLRVCFNWEEELLQIITDYREIPWTEHDISAEKNKEEAVESIRAKDWQERFDLSKPGLLRLHWIMQSEDYGTLLLSMHHSITDGWSYPILFQRVHEYYEAGLRGKVLSVVEDRAYAAAQRYFHAHQSEVQAYWQERMKAMEQVNDLNALFTQPADLDTLREVREGREAQLSVGGALYHRLKTLARSEGITLNVLLQLAWHKLLQVYTRDAVTVVGTTVSGRGLPIAGIEESVGLYINTLPLIIDWQERTVQAQLGLIHQYTTELNNHSYINLAHLQTAGQRLFHSLFIFANYPVGEAKAGSLKFKFRNAMEKLDYPLCIVAYETAKGLQVNLKYAGEYLSDAKAGRLLSQMERILRGIPDQLHQSHSQLSLLDPEEYEQTIYRWNETDRDYPQDQTILELFAEQVKKVPGNTAVVYEEKSLSYQELDEKSNQLARYIRRVYFDQTQENLTPDTLIGLCVERSLEMVIGIWGILKSGAAYVPLDTNSPPERLHYILGDIQTKVILTQSRLVEAGMTGETHQLILLDQENYLEEDKQGLEINYPPESLVYVIYTSGTTGHPKGVMIQHGALVNRLVGMQRKYHINSQDKILQKTSYCFEPSVRELLLPLICGGQSVLMTPGAHRIPAEVYTALYQYDITRVYFVPSMLQAYLDWIVMNGANLNPSPALLTVFSGGEALALKVYTQFNHLYPHVAFQNLYGPTETTLNATQFACHPGIKAVYMGRPVDNTKVYILDAARQPMPVGVIGELYIGGVQVARGYLNRPELTAERFVANPFATPEDQAKGYDRLYKTGDLVRWLPDGNLEYIGRNDFQVKIRGYRIELGEIESDLRDYPTIKRSVVTVHEREGTKSLVAYYVAEKPISEDRLIKHLVTKLPDYMIPNAFVYLESLPLTSSGKLDRRALPAPEFKAATNYVAPRDALETKLVSIWERVLHIDKIGITDDFFKMGGNSILAIKTLVIMEKEIVTIKPSIFFTFRSIKSLAGFLKKENNYQPIVSLNNNKGQKNNLFMIHPARTDTEVYLDLANKLETQYYCLGIENYNLSHENKIDNLEKLAKLYLQHIESFQRKVHYYFLGWSLGGHIALEVAYLLEQKGIKNIMVCLLDTILPDSYIKLKRKEFDSKQRTKDNYIQAGFDPSYIERVMLAFYEEINILNSQLTGHLNDTQVILFKAMQVGPRPQMDDELSRHMLSLKDNNLSAYCKKLKIINLPCSHYNIMSFAEQIANYLLSPQIQ